MYWSGLVSLNPNGFENVILRSQNKLFLNYQQFSSSILETDCVCFCKILQRLYSSKAKIGSSIA